MTRSPWKTLIALLITCLIGSSLGGLLVNAADAPAVVIQDSDVVAWVDQRVAAWQPTEQDRRFDAIGWVDGILEAERLAQEHQRPVFLFTHDGRIAIGRC